MTDYVVPLHMRTMADSADCICKGLGCVEHGERRSCQTTVHLEWATAVGGHEEGTWLGEEVEGVIWLRDGGGGQRGTLLYLLMATSGDAPKIAPLGRK